MIVLFSHLTKVLPLPMFLAAAIMLGGCKSKYGDASDRRIADEEKAEVLLQEARTALKAGEYAVAKNKVKEMRKNCPYALSCRKAGILLMDSIELMDAQRDTTQADREMRVKFYLKKLQHDHIELNAAPEK